MEQAVAIRLIEGGVEKSKASHWADLGAGNGVFTNALATRLGYGNTIYAIDQNEEALKSIKNTSKQASIVITKSNFVHDNLDLPPLDGILMANSLHYVKAKHLFIANLKKMLKPQGRLLIIEYDTLTSNQWVPYPINFSSLQDLMKEAGFSMVKKLAEQPSQFRSGNIYSALAM